MGEKRPRGEWEVEGGGRRDEGENVNPNWQLMRDRGVASPTDQVCPQHLHSSPAKSGRCDGRLWRISGI